MKPDRYNLRTALDRCEPGEPPADQVSSSVEAVWERLKPEAENVTLNASPKTVRSSHVIVAALITTGLILLVSATIVRNFISQKNFQAVVEIADRRMAVTAVDGITRAVGMGATVALGEMVRSASNGSLILTDGSRLEMRAETELSLEQADDGIRVRLNRGSLLVTAAPQRTGHLYVQTKDVLVSVVGTLFLVNAEKQGSRVAVIAGEVRVLQGQTSTTLLPGEQVATNPLMDATPIAEGVSWSRGASEHLALLQQTGTIATKDRAASAELSFDAVSVRPISVPGAGPGGRQPDLSCVGVDGRVRPPGPAPLTVVPKGRCVGMADLQSLIAIAYGIHRRTVSGLPEWGTTTFSAFQVEGVAESPSTVTTDELRQMLRTMLIDRFKLKVRREPRESEEFALLIADSGPKLRETTEDEELPLLDFKNDRDGMHTIVRGKSSIRLLAERLTYFTGPVVSDQTQLTGRYNYTLDLRHVRPSARPPGRDIFDPPLATALQEQLGLRLESRKVMVEQLAVEHVEKPSGN